MKFSRTAPLRRKNHADATGRVQIRVILMNGTGPKKGNLSRSVIVGPTQVSTVFAAIEKSLID